MNLGYYFPSMRSIVNRVVSTCHQCQRANAHKNTNLASFAANMAPFPSMKWRVISSDLIGPFTATPEGYRYAMIVMDTFTKYAILIPMRRQDETTTADALFYEVFMTRGFPILVVRFIEMRALVKYHQVWSLPTTRTYLCLRSARGGGQPRRAPGCRPRATKTTPGGNCVRTFYVMHMSRSGSAATRRPCTPPSWPR